MSDEFLYLREVAVSIEMQRRVVGIDIQRDPQSGGADAEMAVFAPIGDIPDLVIACT
ncbi:hypothetical protein D3C81_1972830 [compost metagenome]